MKLVKLSLAAVVAAGAFSAVNAVALDEAIQNVELHGLLRYRYDAKRTIDDGVHSGTPFHKTRVNLKFSSEIADNFKAHATVRYDSAKEFSYDNTKALQNADTQNYFKLREAFLEYNNFDTKVLVGKMQLNTIWTDSQIGDGIKVLNNSIDGLTFAAFMFDNFDRSNGDLVGEISGPAADTSAPAYVGTDVIDADLLAAIKANDAAIQANIMEVEGAVDPLLGLSAKLDYNSAIGKAGFGETVTLDKLPASVLEYINANAGKFPAKTPAAGDTTTTKTVTIDPASHNIYGAAVIADFEPVSAQLWVSYLNKIGTFYAVDLALDTEVSDGFKVFAHGQYAGNSMKGEVKDLGVKNGNFFALEAGLEVAGLDAKAGWINYGKKGEATLHVLDDKGQLIDSGELVIDSYNGGDSKNNYFFGEFGYTMDGIRAGFDVVAGTEKYAEGKVKVFEITPRLSYKYSDKLSFSTFYAIGQEKLDDSKVKERKLRLEAKYKF